MGAGRPGNKASAGRWEGKISLSNALEPTPAKYSPQTMEPIANANRAPARNCAPFPLDELIHSEHPMAKYANDDHGDMRVGLATWPNAKSPRKASAVRTMSAAVALPNERIFMPVPGLSPNQMMLQILPISKNGDGEPVRRGYVQFTR
jgi:hypothetical protein